ncbi:histidine phosphatase family protein [Flavobacterium sp. GSP27]|uniref:Histidine phosphatase family protein n=1 Tax=Flavobacterium bomense TaxID=2497483 RepID=A0A432CPY2_9FLAO|nr:MULTISPECIES: phosphoglycerate mutase family protein [Flavobacterium]RTY96701.1 histidine phosphatase family protein [Flavobacterium sp. GSN2]RTY69534.1 histidine phosphatase family protein [Flavobacterium sp. LB2P53]RTY75179.1 histidine phosphatase family protein [Flavobacterium sp. LS1R10]RTY78896.1 histidine phosphatase family protein [Flavobacterium sp. LS1P28]RTY92209.1 histidine phosphatase family protein [Flavobacterium sp. RSP46]
MKNLIIVRHAKSSWEVSLHDKDRALTKRGIQDAHLVSSDISHFIPKTYLIWTSTAKRATDTALIFAQNLAYPIDCIIYKDDLYTFDEKKLEKAIKSCSNSFENIILFGHNGAVTNFVNKFGDVFVENIPTTGFVSLEFDTENWKKIKKGKIKKIIFPKDLR